MGKKKLVVKEAFHTCVYHRHQLASLEAYFGRPMVIFNDDGSSEYIRVDLSLDDDLKYFNEVHKINEKPMWSETRPYSIMDNATVF